MTKKVVLITGTNSGFGWLTANSLATLGHKVYATMRHTTGKNADKAKALSQVENVTVVEMELTDETSVQKAFEYIITQEGKIDVLVNNAGHTATGVLESFTAKDVQAMYNVHVFGYWRLMKLALPSMRKQGEGLIINISSGGGRMAFPFLAAYNSAKFALEGLSESLHYEVKHLGVDVAVVEPGAYPTGVFSKGLIGSDGQVTDAYKGILPIYERMGAGLGQFFEAAKPNPQDVADAIVNLISLPKGKRPLRTVVDGVTGALVEAVNETTKVQSETMLRAFGMAEFIG